MNKKTEQKSNRMPEHFRRSLQEQSQLEVKDHPEGNRARPNNDWPPPGGEPSGQQQKTQAAKSVKDDAGAAKAPDAKAKDEEAANN